MADCHAVAAQSAGAVTKITAHFINVDLDLKSTSDLSPLREAWSRQTIAIHVGKDGRRHWLRLMLLKQGRDPSEAILEFCRLAGQLRGAARVAWQNAVPREFDIGIQAGFERGAAEWVLPPQVIDAVRNTRARIRMTVYSPLPLLVERKRQRQKARRRTATGRRIARVSLNRTDITVHLADGLSVFIPIRSSWRLANATRTKLASWQLLDKGRRIYWPDIGEELTIDEILDGIPVERQPAQRGERTSKRR